MSWMEGPLTNEATVGGPYTARVLPPEEWLARKGELPYRPGDHDYDPTHAFIVVVENAEGVIVASWIALETVHLEGLHIDPAYRRNPVVDRLLRDTMIGELQAAGVTAVLTIVVDPAILALAQKGGFVALPGTLCQLTFPTPPAPKEP